MLQNCRFDRFEFLGIERQLHVDGQRVAVGARAFDVLRVLIERRERVVSKQELLDLVWPGLAVEEANVQVQVSSLRKLLGHDVVATVPGRGYQFAMPVEDDPELPKDRPALPIRRSMDG